MKALLLALAITGAQPATADHVQQLVSAAAPAAVHSPDPASLASGSGHSTSNPGPLLHAQTLPAEPVEDGVLLDTIIGCESGGDPAAQNPTSSASGIYQFIDSTWRYVWRDYLGQEPPTPRAHQATVADQHRAGRALYEHEGTTPWNASRSCWAGAA